MINLVLSHQVGKSEVDNNLVNRYFFFLNMQWVLRHTVRRKTLIFSFFFNFDTMRTAENNSTIVDGYVGLLNNLSTNNKLDLISKLTASVKTDLTTKQSSFKKAFGAFDSKKSAEEIIDEIRKSRSSTRQIEPF